MREAGAISRPLFLLPLPTSKVTTAEPFASRRDHLHRQVDQQQTQITMNKLNSALLNLTTLALLALTPLTPRTVHADGGAVDTMSLTDEPGKLVQKSDHGDTCYCDPSRSES